LFIQAVEQAIIGKEKDAMATLEQVIRLQPNYAAAFFARAQLRDLQGAMADYDQAIRINPNFADA
jgi:tetratricopeptide (TPR) repeat protein